MAELEQIEIGPARIPLMQRKIFWLLFLTLGALMDLLVPWIWGLALTLPLLVLCWWTAYRSGWFE
jgi:hypothetical protein